MKKYESFHYYIKEKYDKDAVVLELGSGVGTNILLEKFKVFSVEDNTRFLGVTKSNYIHAPITNYGTYRWYNINTIKTKMPSNYDVFVIDGPIGTIGRIGVIENCEMFDSSVEWIVDDVNRPQDMKTLVELSKKLNREFTIYDQTDKQFGVLHPLNTNK